MKKLILTLALVFGIAGTAVSQQCESQTTCEAKLTYKYEMKQFDSDKEVVEFMNSLDQSLIYLVKTSSVLVTTNRVVKEKPITTSTIVMNIIYPVKVWVCE